MNKTLKELSIDLDISTAWINKIQNMFDKVKKVDTKGKQVIFTDADIELIKTIRILRMFGYSLDHIKEILKSTDEYKEAISNKRKVYLRLLS